MRWINLFGILVLILTGISGCMAEESSNSSDLISSTLKIRDELSVQLNIIDNAAASVSLRLRDSESDEEAVRELLSDLCETNDAVVFSALVSPDGTIRHISPQSYTPLLNTSLPYPVPVDLYLQPALTDPILYEMPPVLSQIIPSGRDLLWPVRLREGPAVLVIHLNDKNLVSDVIDDAGVLPEVFWVVMDAEGMIIGTSDMDEVLNVPPEDVLTEFPTFRDVKLLMLSVWSGYTSYDVWGTAGTVRTGSWSSVRFYNQVYRILLAGKIS
jgi:hypothetical protein